MFEDTAKGMEALGVVFKNTYLFEAFDKDGNLKWSEEISNLVTTAGLNDVLDKYLKGSNYTAAWFAGLKGAGAPAAADTMASHAAWAEVTQYDEAARPALAFGTPSNGAVSATQVTFTINATVTIAGGFITSSGTKGGSTGVLYGVANFASNRDLVDNDELRVTHTVSMASM